jgi:predicted membrane-bound spermidine synthase
LERAVNLVAEEQLEKHHPFYPDKWMTFADTPDEVEHTPYDDIVITRWGDDLYK